MSQLLESPIFDYLGQLGHEVDIYLTTFKSAEVEIMGESPYLNARDAGISFALNKKLKIEAIFLYADKVEDFKQYQDVLPGGLTFEMSRAQVRKALGGPSMSGEVGNPGIFAIEFSFDRYESDSTYLRLEYAGQDKYIRLITMGKV
jgi:hypothetical protein